MLLLYEIDDELEAGPRALVADSGVIDVIARGGLLVDVGALGGHDREGVVRLRVVPLNRVDALLLQLVIELHEILKGVGHVLVRYDRAVADHGDGLDAHRVAPGLAVHGQRVPGELEELVPLLGIRRDRRYEAGVRPLAEAVMRPEVDVRTLAAGGGLLELDLGLLLVLNLYLYSGFLGIALRDLGKRIVVSRVARPDGKERINGAVFFCKSWKCGN